MLRRLVWSEHNIYIAREGEEFVVDSIPFAEIEEIVASEYVHTSHPIDLPQVVLGSKETPQGVTASQRGPSAGHRVHPHDPEQGESPVTSHRGHRPAAAAAAAAAAASSALLKIRTVEDGVNSGSRAAGPKRLRISSPVHGSSTLPAGFAAASSGQDPFPARRGTAARRKRPS